MALQGIRRIAPGIVQDPAINSGRPIIKGPVFLSIISSDILSMVCQLERSAMNMI
jgi:uncharacterized protein (DUF433 family)